MVVAASRSREQPMELVGCESQVILFSCSVAESVTPGTAKGLKTLVVLELRGVLAGGPPDAQDRAGK